MAGKRIVVILQKGAMPKQMKNYAVVRYAEIWKRDGHQVQAAIGPASAPGGDLALVHVDLSVVPEVYLQLAARYPVALNTRIRDVRKSVVSRNLVRPGDGYRGPVIVKSDLNHAGVPESVALRQPRGVFSRPDEYQVYDDYEQVPAEHRANSDLVVERFLPEREGDLYCVRFYNFIGEHHTCFRLKGPSPVVKGSTKTHSEVVEPDASVIALRKELGMDYGKIDYTLHQGRAVVIDVNKTVGAGGMDQDEDMLRLREHRARGLYQYFRD